MISMIAIPNTPRSGLGKLLTLVGYSSVFPNIAETRRFKSESQYPSQQSAEHL